MMAGLAQFVHSVDTEGGSGFANFARVGALVVMGRVSHFDVGPGVSLFVA